MTDFKSIFTKSLSFLLKANFIVAVILIVYAAILVMADDTALFESDDLDLYGPLVQNLRIILIYVAIAEVNIAIYCLNHEKQHVLFGVGLFYLGMVGGVEFYSRVNQLPIQEDYGSFFLYQGISHVLYGAPALYAKIYAMRKKKRKY